MDEFPAENYGSDWSDDDRFNEFYIDRRDNQIYHVTPYAISILKKKFKFWELNIGEQQLTVRDMCVFMKSKMPFGVICNNKERFIVSFDKTFGTLMVMSGDLETMRNNFFEKSY